MKTKATKAAIVVDINDLPVGVYDGTWFGYDVTLKIQGVWYTLAVNDGMRGVVNCVVTVDDEVTVETRYPGN